MVRVECSCQSDGVEKEAYGDQAAATSDQFSRKREEPSRKSCSQQHLTGPIEDCTITSRPSDHAYLWYE